NGINLTGLDIARLYLKLHENPSLTIPQFLSEEEIFFKVALPRSRHFELPQMYPWMLSGGSANGRRSWIVSFARSGFPLKLEPGERKVNQPEIVFVKPSSLNASYLTDGIATGSTNNAHLTEHGKQLMQLLIYPD